MQFKERDRRVYLKFLGYSEKRHETQCPVCKEWFRTFGRSNNVRQHVHIIAKNEAFLKAMGLINKTPHLNFYKKSVVVHEYTKKFMWKI